MNIIDPPKSNSCAITWEIVKETTKIGFE